MTQMSVVVRTIARLATPLILIFGLYVIMHGHLTPGGGFQGGAVVASAFALLLVAYGVEKAERWFREKSFSLAEGTGAVAFIALAAAGLGAAFFYNVLWREGVKIGGIPIFSGDPTYMGNLNSAGVLPLMNLAVGLKVIAGLGAVVLIMALFRGDES